MTIVVLLFHFIYYAASVYSKVLFPFWRTFLGIDPLLNYTIQVFIIAKHLLTILTGNT